MLSNKLEVILRTNFSNTFFENLNFNKSKLEKILGTLSNSVA